MLLIKLFNWNRAIKQKMLVYHLKTKLFLTCRLDYSGWHEWAVDSSRPLSLKHSYGIWQSCAATALRRIGRFYSSFFCSSSQNSEQENHAIAKMTARCAQYMNALKIVCKRQVSRRLHKNRHITILSLFGGEIIFEVFQPMWLRYLIVAQTLQADRHKDAVASPRGKNRKTNYRRYYRYHRYFKSKIPVYCRL